MHSSEEQRLIIERIDASFADSIRNDEEQALTLLVERCRLVVYGSLAAIAASAAAVATMSPPPMPWLVGGGVVLLQAGAYVAWHGLGHAEILRHNRVSRKHLERQAMLHARFGATDPLYPDPGQGNIATAREDERRSGDRVRSSTTLGLFLAACGFSCMLGAFIQVIEDRRAAAQMPPIQGPSGPLAVSPTPTPSSAEKLPAQKVPSHVTPVPSQS